MKPQWLLKCLQSFKCIIDSVKTLQFDQGSTWSFIQQHGLEEGWEYFPDSDLLLVWLRVVMCVHVSGIHICSSVCLCGVSVSNIHSHSISRNMLFWCPPILLRASQSKRPQSDRPTPTMVSMDSPWCPRTSTRSSGLWKYNHMALYISWIFNWVWTLNIKHETVCSITEMEHTI